MLRVSVLKKNNLHFDESFKYISDLELWIKILQYGDGYYCNDILTAFRLHKDQGTITLFRRAFEEHIILSSKHSEEFGLRVIDHLIINIKLLTNFYLKLLLITFFIRK